MLNSGRGGEIRTPDILLPKQARYQATLYIPWAKKSIQVAAFFSDLRHCQHQVINHGP
jgi:hypothetical protein